MTSSRQSGGEGKYAVRRGSVMFRTALWRPTARVSWTKPIATSVTYVRLLEQLCGIDPDASSAKDAGQLIRHPVASKTNAFARKCERIVGVTEIDDRNWQRRVFFQQFLVLPS